MTGLGPDWNTFESTVRETHNELFDFETVEVYNYTGGYDKSDGKTSWSRESEGTEITAEARPASAQEVSSEYGWDADNAGVLFTIRDDHDATLHPVGTDNQRPTEFEWDGDTYVLHDIVNQNNGLLTCYTQEVDE